MPSLSMQILGARTPAAEATKATISRIDGTGSQTLSVLTASGFDEIAARWAILDRPGETPLTIHAGRNSDQASLTVRVQGYDRNESVESRLLVLRGMARGSRPVIVALGRMASWTPTGAWVITHMGVNVEDRVAGSNEVARATVELTLRAALTPEQLRRGEGLRG